MRRFEPFWPLPIVVALVFVRLGYPSLLDPDEAHYAQLTREMVAAGNWLVPLLDGVPYIDKPVLFHWLQGAATTTLGQSEWSVRLPSALAALALFAVTRQVGVALFGSRAGQRAALMFATIPMTFALARIGLLDMVYSAFLFGSLGCLLIAMRQGSARVEWSGYLLLALAVMTKGPMALALIGFFCGTAWLLGGDVRAHVQRLRWKTGLLCAAALASPWFLYMFSRFGEAFVQGYLLAGNLHYVTQPPTFSGRTVSHSFYVRAFAFGFFPWSLLVLARVIDLAVSRRPHQPAVDVHERLLWLWGILIIAFFSVARFKLDHYIFPAAPAICLIAARGWEHAATWPARYPMTRVTVIGLGGSLIVAGSFGTVYLWELNLGLPAVAIALPLVLMIGGATLLATAAARSWRVPTSTWPLLATLVAVYAAAMAFGLPVFEGTRATSLVARTVKNRTAPDAPTAIYRLEQWRATLRYYADRPLVRLSTPEEVAAFVRSSAQPVYVVATRREYRLLRNLVSLREVFRRRCVVRTSRLRLGLRQQHWDDLVVLTNAPNRGEWRP